MSPFTLRSKPFSMSFCLPKVAKRNPQGSCNLKHHPDISILSLTLGAFQTDPEVHSFHSLKPIVRKHSGFLNMK